MSDLEADLHSHRRWKDAHSWHTTRGESEVRFAIRTATEFCSGIYVRQVGPLGVTSVGTKALVFPSDGGTRNPRPVHTAW